MDAPRRSLLRFLHCRAKFLLSVGFGVFSLMPTLSLASAAELPLVRIAHGAFNEKVEALWIGVEQRIFRKQGINVEVINIRSGPQTIAALASGEIQIAYTIPGTVLSAAAAGMDVAFFGGLVNRADGDFVVAPAIRSAEDLKGKRVGVQSIGGGVWSLAMLALEYLGLEPTRDKILMMVLGDQSVLTQAMSTGAIDAAYLGYTFSTLLKEKGFRVLLDIGKAPIPYQGLALAARRSYLRENRTILDSVLRGALESVAFIHQPTRREVVLKSLSKNLRLKSAQEAESGYEVLQWLYSLDIRPSLKGIQNMQRLLSVTNPKVKDMKAEEVVDEGPVQRLEATGFYRELVSAAKRQ
jgi:ABC-type nitrate/sulfonate/bicarbonate transport system substrate-binding protein